MVRGISVRAGDAAELDEVRIEDPLFFMKNGPSAGWVSVRHLVLVIAGTLTALLFWWLFSIVIDVGMGTTSILTVSGIGGLTGFLTSLLLPLDNDD